jgi:hypothetical protein
LKIARRDTEEIMHHTDLYNLYRRFADKAEAAGRALDAERMVLFTELAQEFLQEAQIAEAKYLVDQHEWNTSQREAGYDALIADADLEDLKY